MKREARGIDAAGVADCCIVGGGPAGMVLALLLARVGLEVTVLESQPDFERDFRGDTLHASTLEMLEQIGLAERALAIPHAKLRQASIHAGNSHYQLADFGRLRSRYPFIAIMPQAEFLEFLCAEAARYPGFRCLRSAPAVGLLESGGRISGVRYRHNGEERTLSANLVVAADGRFSRLRRLTGAQATQRAAPMDVCWFRLPRFDADGGDSGGFFVGRGRMLITIPRATSWQIGYVFPKGDFGEVRASGIDAFRRSVAETVPWLADRTATITDFDAVHLLNVKADCLATWHRPGLLFIGDAAHVMSPVGGVGINAAISDAVETANVLAHPDHPRLAHGPPPENLLAEIQRRRARPTRIIQAVQSRIQDLLVRRAISGREFDVPLPVRALIAIPGVRQIPIRIFALGVSRTRLQL
ncbi:MAG TPA: FAD-dependent oxidoreductase [Pseudomonadales bacterium]